MQWRRGLMAALAALVLGSGVNEANADFIAQWNFPTVTPAPDNSPAPDIGSGTATVLGMTNNYTYGTPTAVLGSGSFTFPAGAPTGSTASADVLATAGDPSGDPNAWRVRGATNNGWALQAPQYTQGAQFSVDTTGYSNVHFSFDWYTTTQGVKDLQEQYTLDGSTWNDINGLQIATPNGFAPAPLTIDFSGIAGAANNPNFGVRLVSAWDPTMAIPNYGSASGGLYNNSSGNWRFTAVTFSGTPASVPEPSSMVLTALGGVAVLGFARRRVRRSNV